MPPSTQAGNEACARIGVDVGGTFTDLVLHHPGRDLVHTGKLLTTPEDPSVAIIDGLTRLLRETNIGPGEVQSIVHGTTLVTNAIIERRGAVVGLITTEGFRDTIEIGRETRYDLYDLFLEPCPPLVPRFRRLEVPERISAEGEILLKLDEATVAAAARRLVEQDGIEALAIAFMHSYRMEAHEQRAAEIVRALYPGLPVTLSAEVAPEIREFERTSTACANAYVQPLMQRYLDRLEASLGEIGLSGRLYIMLSGGGITTVREARNFPIRLIESGPAAGAMAASLIARLCGLDKVVSFDMGGTTAKMCLVENGEPDHKFEFEAGRVRRFQKGSGLPLKVSVIDMIEIGAGGGSLAHVDPGSKLLKVGPRSAGARPGPVCYGAGGTEPTVTDADLLLGRLDPGYFLGGEMKLDRALLEAAFAAAIPSGSGFDARTAALGVQRIVDETMAAATRLHFAEKGKDPAQPYADRLRRRGAGARPSSRASLEDRPGGHPIRRRRGLRARISRRPAGDRHGADLCHAPGAGGLGTGQCNARGDARAWERFADRGGRRGGRNLLPGERGHASCRPGLRYPRTVAGRLAVRGGPAGDWRGFLRGLPREVRPGRRGGSARDHQLAARLPGPAAGDSCRTSGFGERRFARGREARLSQGSVRNAWVAGMRRL